MLVVQMLLPRFLVLEVVLFFHFLQHTHCCKTLMRGVGDKKKDDNPTECHIDLDDSEVRWKPLITSAARSLVAPSHSVSMDGQLQRIVRISSNESALTVSCPGATIKSTNLPEMKVSCLEGSNFIKEGDGEIIQPADFACSRSVRETVRQESTPCGPSGGATISQIGWTINGKFLNQISVCHSSHLEHTYYTNHTIRGRYVHARNVDEGRPNFKEGPFYDQSSAATAYKLRTQKQTFHRLLGESQGQRLFKHNKVFFAKGHLAADADFLHREWQDATYYYANAAPQWQTFNNGNWKSLEMAVRKMADQRKTDIVVYTGTLDQLMLTDDGGNRQNMYLAETANDATQNNGLIPVPRFFWKVVIDPLAYKAIAFVGLNNPHAEQVKEPYVFCQDVCDASGWPLPNRKDFVRGYMFCCSFADFRRTVDWIPNMGNPDLLTFLQ